MICVDVTAEELDPITDDALEDEDTLLALDEDELTLLEELLEEELLEIDDALLELRELELDDEL